jgi:hypothetical protein
MFQNNEDYIEIINDPKLLAEMEEAMVKANKYSLFKDILPTKNIEEYDIKVEWVESNLRLTGVIKPGMANKLSSTPVTRTMLISPAYFRKGDSAGTKSHKHLAEDVAMMFDVLRGTLLQGDIDYTDPETGINVYVASGIRNKFDVVRDDLPTVIRAELDRLAALHVPASAKIIMNVNLAYQLAENPTEDMVVVDGKVTEIFGAPVLATSMLYDEQKDGKLIRRYVWDPNTVSVVASDYAEPVGYTYLTPGENPSKVPGIWIRDVMGPASHTYQVGCAGIPFLKHPNRVSVIKIK